MKRRSFIRAVSVCIGMIAFDAQAAWAAMPYDIVITNGRVIDPESGLDAIRNIGIRDGKIKIVTTSDVTGRQRIDGTGLVVSPGFIDLHAHGQNLPSQTYQVMDGVTTALELERGAHPLEDPALSERTGHALINYGYSASHRNARYAVKDRDWKRTFHEVATDAERARILSLLEEDIDKGAIGIGLLLDYVSRGVNDAELEGIFRLAARKRVLIVVHIRMPDDIKDPSGFQEIIDMTRRTGASVHMAHVVSTGLGRVPLFLKMLDQARAEGLDITTELYPYTATSTGINSGIFDHDWQKKAGISYGDIEWPPTGERFTGKEMWDSYRAKYPDGVIIAHAMKEEWVEMALKHPQVIVASDGIEIHALDERAHPRGMGTFSRVLGYYVRERKILSLQDALSRMTILPARRLESFVPTMKHKGRISAESDADITIFDPQTIKDQATFAEPDQFSTGIRYVLVSGKVVVENGNLTNGILPGTLIRAAGQGR